MQSFFCICLTLKSSRGANPQWTSVEEVSSVQCWNKSPHCLCKEQEVHIHSG